jgi:hypothetical protein
MQDLGHGPPKNFVKNKTLSNVSGGLNTLVLVVDPRQPKEQAPRRRPRQAMPPRVVIPAKKIYIAALTIVNVNELKMCHWIFASQLKDLVSSLV